eukprot:TRINITY_DN21935_c0_g1_i2.p1 TRINITY_DN21935_c0_g1~~TRINITY_DN21935_c0_g1_i2.p1  ORF type:complete len:350 (-),score=55.50 TRINITY_DN21935_c0_g1_i2:246-1220(-)
MGGAGSKQQYDFKIIGFKKDIMPVDGHNRTMESMYPKIGAGGYGTVYKGMYRGELIAFKVFHNEWQGDMNKTEKDEWIRSMTMLCRMEHPNITKCYGVTMEKGYRALVMQYANKGNLFSWIHKKKQTLSEGMILKILRAVARALVYLHNQKIIHRDIKTENILMHQEMQPDGSGTLVVKVADFDLTQYRQDTYVETVRGRGTLNYAAPELYTPPGRIDEKVDIYSLAMVAYECVSEQIPWYNTTEMTIVDKVSNRAERPNIPATCSPNLRKLIQVCWSQHVQDRPTASQLEKMCDDLLEKRTSSFDLNLENNPLRSQSMQNVAM